MVPLATNVTIGKITNGNIREPRTEPLYAYHVAYEGDSICNENVKIN